MKKKKKSRIGYRVAAGVMDVFGVAASALAIVVLMLMLGSLYTWVRQDLTVTFADLTHLTGVFLRQQIRHRHYSPSRKQHKLSSNLNSGSI